MDIHELYLKAGELHGHYCPGLAIGVRAGAEALRILEVEKKGFNLYCIAENRACYQDGIQMVFGTTLGDGNLELRQRGKTAFNFYDRDTGKSVRLVMSDWPKISDRKEMAEFILSAPLEQVFAQTPVHFDAPPNTFTRHESRLRVVDGEIVCLDCAES